MNYNALKKRRQTKVCRFILSLQCKIAKQAKKLNSRIKTNGSGEHRIVNLSRRHGAKTVSLGFALSYQTRRAEVFRFFPKVGKTDELATPGFPLEGKVGGVAARMRCSLRQQALFKRLYAVHICSQHFIFFVKDCKLTAHFCVIYESTHI